MRKKADTCSEILDCRIRSSVIGTNVEGKVVVGTLGHSGFSNTISNRIMINLIK